MSRTKKSQSLLRQRILPDVHGVVQRGFGRAFRLNRFFVSEYFRTEITTQTGGRVVVARLNRFFVSEYFRTPNLRNVQARNLRRLNRFFVSEYFRTWCANAEPGVRWSLNRFFVSEYFRTA